MVGQRNRAIATLALSAGICLALAVAGFLGGLRLNFTPSYPIGIWRIESLNRQPGVGDRVFICPPDAPAFALGMERGYLPAGLCPGGTAPLIKTIVAVAGQVIALNSSVIIDGAALASSSVRSTDAQGRALPKFAGGRVPLDHVFLHSDFGGSYDSRYFGPLPADGILGLARPVLVFAP
jgi:conjugative transfer signal peptidase TraF